MKRCTGLDELVVGGVLDGCGVVQVHRMRETRGPVVTDKLKSNDREWPGRQIEEAANTSYMAIALAP